MRQNQEDPQWGREICRCSRCGGELYCGQTYYEVEDVPKTAVICGITPDASVCFR